MNIIRKFLVNYPGFKLQFPVEISMAQFPINAHNEI